MTWLFNYSAGVAFQHRRNYPGAIGAGVRLVTWVCLHHSITWLFYYWAGVAFQHRRNYPGAPGARARVAARDATRVRWPPDRREGLGHPGEAAHRGHQEGVWGVFLKRFFLLTFSIMWLFCLVQINNTPAQHINNTPASKGVLLKTLFFV